MDSFTQAALGGVVGQALMGRRLGTRATAIGAAVAILPDLDMLVRLWGPWASLEHHRGVSHSFLMLPAYILVCATLLWWLYRKKDRWRDWCLLVFFAVGSHPVLDWCTPYGTQLFAPLTRMRFANDAIAVIDLCYSLPLLAALILGWQSRLEATTRLRWCRGILIVTSLYLILGWGVGQYFAGRAVETLEKQNIEVARVRATPMFLSVLVRQITIRTKEGRFYRGAASAFYPDRLTLTPLDNMDTPAVKECLASDKGKLFNWFSQGMLLARNHKGPDGITVRLSDMRYGFLTRPEGTPFTVAFRLSPQGDIQSVTREHGRSGLKIGPELRAMWRLLWHGPAAKKGNPQ